MLPLVSLSMHTPMWTHPYAHTCIWTCIWSKLALMWTYKVLQFLLVLKIAFVKSDTSINCIGWLGNQWFDWHIFLPYCTVYYFLSYCMPRVHTEKNSVALINAGTPLPPLIVYGIHVWAYLDVWGEDVHACGGSRLMLRIIAYCPFILFHKAWSLDKTSPCWRVESW